MDNNIKNKFFELNDEELDQVSGGTVYISAGYKQIAFSNLGTVYNLKNCTPQQARDFCESMIGKYATDAEYDAACEAALKEMGWI